MSTLLGLPKRISRRVFVFAAIIVSICNLSAAPAEEFPPIPRSEFTPAQFGPHEPRLYINYPGGAASKSIAEGSATVSVLVDATGIATDFLITRETDPSFGKALLDELQTSRLVAAQFQKTPVPARLEVSYDFKGDVSANAMDQAARMGGIKWLLQPTTEDKLDHRLEFVDAALPRLPLNFANPENKTISVYVTFYVDEQGHARIPNVDSAISPALIAPAIKAVRIWAFKPPLVKGKPAIVFTARAVNFVPRTPPVTPTSTPPATK